MLVVTHTRTLLPAPPTWKCAEALDVEHAVVANAYAAPHVKYELAQMAYDDGDWTASKEYLDAAAKHKSYTWDDFLVKVRKKRKKGGGGCAVRAVFMCPRNSQIRRLN